MHLSLISQYSIQNIKVHISVLNNVSCDMGQVHCGICETVPLNWYQSLMQYLQMNESKLSACCCVITVTDKSLKKISTKAKFSLEIGSSYV